MNIKTKKILSIGLLITGMMGTVGFIVIGVLIITEFWDFVDFAITLVFGLGAIAVFGLPASIFFRLKQAKIEKVMHGITYSEIYSISELAKKIKINPILVEKIIDKLIWIGDLKGKIVNGIFTPKTIADEKSSVLRQSPSINVQPEGKQTNKLNPPFKIFISYSTEDADLFKISDLAANLEHFPEIEKVFFWQKDVDDNIIKYMNDRLAISHALILMCSPNSLKSGPIEKEWTAADISNVPVIPVFSDPAHIPMLLRSRLGVKWDMFDLQKSSKAIFDAVIQRFN